MKYREILKQLKDDGWVIVTIRMEQMSDVREHYLEVEGYVVLVEQGPRNCSAFIPDLPGCYAFADTVDEIVEQMKVGIPFHIEGLERDGDPVPAPVRTLEQVIAEQRAESTAA